MISRTLGSIIILISILVLPYWIYIPVLFIGIIFFPFFWESILFALLIDVLYGAGVHIFPPSISLLTLSILIALIILIPLRERLRSYA